jgi:ribosomal protein L40E
MRDNEENLAMATSNRICSQCGTTLAPNETTCNKCGARYPEPFNIDSMQPMTTPSQSTFYPGASGVGSSPSAFSNAPYGNTPFSMGGQSLPPLALPNAEGNPGTGTTIGDAVQQPLPTANSKRQVSKIWLILVVLLLILGVVGSSLYFVLNKGKSSSTISTTNDHITATSSAGPPLFSDNFADNSKGWSTGSGKGFSSTIGNNTMALSEANHKIIDEPIPGSANAPATFTDFSVTTTFTLLKADQNDSVGLYLRGDGNMNQGYFIDIFGDNSYDIVKVFPDASRDTFLISPTSSPDINSLGQQNKLTVMMKGPKMVLLINGKVINSVSDSGYASGQIALFAENGNTSNGISVTFTSVVIYPAPNQLPG